MSNLKRISLVIFIAIAAILEDTEGVCPKGQVITDPKDNFPDIFAITSGSYQLTVEANMEESSKTIYATEYYNTLLGNGRVDTLSAGQSNSFLYLNDTGETFNTTSTLCDSNLLSKTTTAPHDKLGVYGWSNNDPLRPMFGPSNLLRDGNAAFQNKRMLKDNDFKENVVRGIKTDVWFECRNSDKIIVRYFFIDKNTENGFGVKDRPVPARITVEGNTETGKTIGHTYDFVNYQTFESSISVFEIPVQKGCTRLVEDLKEVPVYDKRDFHVEAEVVFTPLLSADTHSYISNLGVTVDAKSGHLAYTFTPWKAHSDTEMAQPGDFEEIIYDFKNAIIYDIDRATQNCQIRDLTDSKDSLPKITLPDNQKIDLLDTNLFITTNASAAMFHYLGDGVERGIPVSIYERKEAEGQILITRYHLADDTYLNSEFSEKDAPVKVVYYGLKEGGDFFGTVVINFYAFSSRFENKAKKFDVTPCFTKDDESKWFQITFPMRENDPRDIIPEIPFIKNNILDIIRSRIIPISPLRIPNIMVDIDADNMYITALLLERPNFMFDFESQGNYGITSEEGVRFTTQTGCAKNCLDAKLCTFFSQCGIACKTSNDNPMTDKNRVYQDDNCAAFAHKKVESSLPTMNEISASIGNEVSLSSISILVPTKNTKKPIATLTATEFKDGIAFGLEGLTKKPEDQIGERFTVFKSGSKFKDVVSDVVKPFGKQSFATCRRLCLNSATCESLSFCMADSMCSLSTKHSEEIATADIVANSQCMILSRTYLDYFQHYEGFTLVQSAMKEVDVGTSELCAKACMEDEKCLSFDYCIFATENKPCLLHAEHFLNLKEAIKLKKELECGHYSRKLVYDFKQTRGQQLVGATSLSIDAIDVEQCAKYCLSEPASSCKAFDFCQNFAEGKSTCRLSKISGPKKTISPTCNSYDLSETGTPQRSPDKSPLMTSPNKKGSVNSGFGRPQSSHGRRG